MSENEKALVPVQQKEVEFYGDELTAVRANDGKIYVALPSMCNALGLNRPKIRIGQEMCHIGESI